MHLKIAVCDDEEKQLIHMRSLLEAWAKERAHLAEVQTFSSAEAFLFAYSEDKSFDILLLDIEMGRMNGVELARVLRAENERLQIVFVTGYDKYIADGYDVMALHYLMKPVSKEKLFAVLDRAARLLCDREKNLVLTVNKATVKIALHEITYIEALQNYAAIHTETAEYKVKMSLSALEKELDDGFFRTGKSYIVGLRYVASIAKTEITLDSGQRIPLGRGLFDAANKAFIKFY
ncbi:MAG: response regulator transcription factor [Clostridia bacterium]|nr:response regulator transcription factor [Clostridia bacterium]